MLPYGDEYFEPIISRNLLSFCNNIFNIPISPKRQYLIFFLVLDVHYVDMDGQLTQL